MTETFPCPDCGKGAEGISAEMRMMGLKPGPVPASNYRLEPCGCRVRKWMMMDLQGLTEVVMLSGNRWTS